MSRVARSGHIMKRFLVFALLGPPVAAVALFLGLLPLAGLLTHGPITMDVSDWLTIYLGSCLSALVLAFFDWMGEVIDIPRRPIGTAIAGWVLAVLALREWLALPDVPGWFVVIGLLGAIPAFICSWVTLKIKTRRFAV
jgi:hypothetical protein